MAPDEQERLRQQVQREAVQEQAMQLALSVLTEFGEKIYGFTEKRGLFRKEKKLNYHLTKKSKDCYHISPAGTGFLRVYVRFRWRGKKNPAPVFQVGFFTWKNYSHTERYEAMSDLPDFSMVWKTKTTTTSAAEYSAPIAVVPVTDGDLRRALVKAYEKSYKG